MTISAFPGGIENTQSFKNPVRAGWMIGAGHDRFAAVGGHGGCDLGRVGCDCDPADAGGFGPAQHMDDHRQAAISSSGLPGRRVAAMRAGIRTRIRGLIIGMRWISRQTETRK